MFLPLTHEQLVVVPCVQLDVSLRVGNDLRAKSDVFDFGVRTWMDVLACSHPTRERATRNGPTMDHGRGFSSNFLSFACQVTVSIPRLAEVVPSNWTLTFVSL